MATSAELKQSIREGAYDRAFAKLYADDAAVIAAQRDRYVELIENFEKNFESLKIYSIFVHEIICINLKLNNFVINIILFFAIIF